ncbi:MAG: carboxypeptidase-like regulatory domain-containing protein, partial [Flavobacteriaceae bacterium]|nr:carboxypeptidase-like regulatory domain-containing protein [Flavobacteriaceae bacterium]
MKKSLLLLLLLFCIKLSAQVVGTVTSKENKPLAVVNIFVENTRKGTTTNNDGYYQLDIKNTGNYTIVFQYLGFKTLKKTVSINSFPFTLDAVLEDEDISLDEVVLDANEDPAIQIIRNTIAKRKENLEKYNTYTADFYSRGLLQLKDAPEKIFGQEIGDLGGSLDSTRSGIIYLSETISKLEKLSPKPLKETITASKVSGNSTGFSFNNATDVDFNFYENTISLESEIVSPIADFAFNYYNYKLVGTFYDDSGHLVNKIEVLPRRENDKTFDGYIYIVEDQWSLFGLELNVTGQQAQIAPVDLFTINQSFSYFEDEKVWGKISQIFDFTFGFMGFNGSGRFTAVYSDYDFNPNLDKNNFSREILSFKDNANKKDSLYWQAKRPVPLTDAEVKDYIKKDSI